MTLGRGTVRSGNGPPPTKPLRRESIGPDSFGPPSVRTLLPLPRETLGPDSSAKRGIRFLGRRNIRRQSRHASPRTREPHFDISPRHACKDKWLRIERLLREGDWLDAYEDALRAWRAGNRDVVFPYGTNKDAKGPPRPRRPPPRLNRLHSSPARQGPALPRAPVRRPPPDGRPKRPLGRSPPPPRALNRAAAAPPPPHSRRLRRETLGPDCLLNPRRL
jgi:hypothetical protein